MHLKGRDVLFRKLQNSGYSTSRYGQQCRKCGEHRVMARGEYMESEYSRLRRIYRLG